MDEPHTLRFSYLSKRALAIARKEAYIRDQEGIDTNHLLLGIIKERGGLAYRLLINSGLGIKKIIESMYYSPRIVGNGVDKKRMYFNPRVDTVLKYAESEAISLGSEKIGTEHILLGLLKEGFGIASQKLEEHGVTYAEIRERVERG